MMLPPFNRKEDKKLVTDVMGRNLTIALFKETNDGRTDIKPIWSIKDWKEVYMDLADPTEYTTAIYLLGDWDHWVQIAEKSQVRAYVAEWRKELIIKLRSLAISYLKKQASGDKGTAAAKWLAENGYILDKKTKTKVEKEQDNRYNDVMSDVKRLKVLNAVK